MAEPHGLKRGLRLLEATALNMSNMVGAGPFVIIPLPPSPGMAAASSAHTNPSQSARSVPAVPEIQG